MSSPGGLLRVLTCGSVDDGKSTLIGRLLHDTGSIPEDVMAALVRDSRKHGTTGDAPDLALLMDGLEAERQQGITIDISHRYFSSAARSFILLDSPGHEQFTRNMATAASVADVAIVLIDARKGVLTQTRRHTAICALMGIRRIVLAVNKMDLVGYAQARFDEIVTDYRAFADKLAIADLIPVPISAREGDQVVHPSANLGWYGGETLLSLLESAAPAIETDAPFRMSVQWVSRPSADFRGFAGTLASGRVAVGDDIVQCASGRPAKVARIVTADGDLPETHAGEAVTLVLDRELDIARGDMLAPAQQRPEMTDQFAAKLIWMDEEALLPGRRYAIRCGHLWTEASVTSIRHRLDVETLDRSAARQLAMNEIGLCHLSTAQRVPFDAYSENRGTGAFILVDRFTNRTVAAGMMAHSLRRAQNIHHEDFPVDKTARAALLGQKPVVVWFTGLSGSGKSSIAKRVEQALHLQGRLTYSLDGDNVRHGLNRDLGFTAADRVENIRRVGEVAKLMADAGLIDLCSFISPFRAERQMVRDLIGAAEFVEVFVDTPIEECIQRDPKGLYAKALGGKLPNFTGIDSPYEAPDAAELTIATSGRSPEDCAAELLAFLAAR